MASQNKPEIDLFVIDRVGLYNAYTWWQVNQREVVKKNRSHQETKCVGKEIVTVA